MAAKKSRDQRKFREEAVAQRADMLERENSMLRTQVGGGGLPSIISNILDKILLESILYPSRPVRFQNNKYVDHVQKAFTAHVGSWDYKSYLHSMLLAYSCLLRV